MGKTVVFSAGSWEVVGFGEAVDPAVFGRDFSSHKHLPPGSWEVVGIGEAEDPAVFGRDSSTHEHLRPGEEGFPSVPAGGSLRHLAICPCLSQRCPGFSTAIYSAGAKFPWEASFSEKDFSLLCSMSFALEACLSPGSLGKRIYSGSWPSPLHHSSECLTATSLAPCSDLES